MLLDATFLGFMQLLVYAGAIMVLYLFVIMLINPRDDSLPEEGGFTEKTFAVGRGLARVFFTRFWNQQLRDSLHPCRSRDYSRSS